jgi:beta-aspartyl-peptidase (threonine type)
MILLDPRGGYGISHNTPRMAWALRTPDDEQWGIDRNL